MRISDWSSDVCSSDLVGIDVRHDGVHLVAIIIDWRRGAAEDDTAACPHRVAEHHRPGALLRPAARHLRPVTKLLAPVERGSLAADGSEVLAPPAQPGGAEDIEVGSGEEVGAGLIPRSPSD